MNANRLVKSCERAVKAQPENLVLKLKLAAALRSAGRLDEAVSVYCAVAMAYHRQGRVSQALAVCRSILEFHPDSRVAQTLAAELEGGGPPGPAASVPTTTSQPVAMPLRMTSSHVGIPSVVGTAVARPDARPFVPSGQATPTWNKVPDPFEWEGSNASSNRPSPFNMPLPDPETGAHFLPRRPVVSTGPGTRPGDPAVPAPVVAAPPSEAAEEDAQTGAVFDAPADDEDAPTRIADSIAGARSWIATAASAPADDARDRVVVDVPLRPGGAPPPPPPPAARATPSRTISRTIAAPPPQERPHQTPIGRVTPRRVAQPAPAPLSTPAPAPAPPRASAPTQVREEPPTVVPTGSTSGVELTPDVLTILRHAFPGLGAEALPDLASGLVVRRYAAGEAVLREGEVGDSCYVVRDGAVRVLKRAGQGGEYIEVARLGPGSLFGEFALLADRRRHASVQALEPTELYEVERRVLREIAANHEGAGRAIEQLYRRRLLSTLLLTAPFFRPVPDVERAALLARFTSRRADEGDVIVREGEPGGGLYLVVLGTVDVTKRLDDGRSTLVATLGEGSYFGEMSLLSGGVASATVRAAGTVELAVLPGRDFYDVLSHYPVLWQEFRDEARRRELALRDLLAGEIHLV